MKSKKPVKQHILPRVYLKHFSLNEDGKSIFVIDRQDKYQKKIAVKNSGDKVFWENNFYNSNKLVNPSDLEELFGQKIESFYNDLVEEIKKEEIIKEWATKQKLITWIYFSIYRNPQWRSIYSKSIEIRNWLSRAYPDSSDKNIKLRKDDIDLISRENHLSHFLDKDIANTNEKLFIDFISCRRWKILKASTGCHWITSDNPGFLLDYDKNRVMPILRFDNEDGLFFPLSKDYAVEIFPYSQDDSVELNISNTDIEREVLTDERTVTLNRFSFATMNRLLISPNLESFIKLGFELARVEKYIK